MKSTIVTVDARNGVQIPPTLLRAARLRGDVEVEVQDDSIVIRRVAHPRDGWEEAFRAMAETGDDAPIEDVAAVSNQWDEEEWEW